jgi:hypothetical protein
MLRQTSHIHSADYFSLNRHTLHEVPSPNFPIITHSERERSGVLTPVVQNQVTHTKDRDRFFGRRASPSNNVPNPSALIIENS